MSFGGLGGRDNPRVGRDNRGSEEWHPQEDEGKILRRNARKKKREEFLRKLWPGNWRNKNVPRG